MSELTYFSYTRADLARMPSRKARSNKGDYGRVLLLCGSVGMAGAAYFAAKAAYRVGAGLVEILTPYENLPVLQARLPEAIVTPYDAKTVDSGETVISPSLARADVVVAGCGLGVSALSRALLSALLRKVSVPCVLDADALNLIAKNPSFRPFLAGKIITPHMGEMARLCGLSISDILDNVPQIAHTFADENKCICVLKDHETIVSDGTDLLYRNNTGNSGMATAGSGDVLAGIIGGILAQSHGQSLSLRDTAALAVFLHGLCGDAAALRLGEYSLMASDILEAIPIVLGGVR